MADPMAQIRALFDEVDTDHSGDIDLAELQALVRRMNLPDDQADRLMELLDLDHDSRISFDEFRQGFQSIVGAAAEAPARERREQEQHDQAPTSVPMEGLMAMFRQIDVDNRGTIDADELRQRVVQLGLPQEQVAALMDGMDTNHDGEITFDEFEAAARRYLDIVSQQQHSSATFESDDVVCSEFDSVVRQDSSMSARKARRRASLGVPGSSVRHRELEASRKISRIPPHKFASLQELFQLADDNSDGVIDREELFNCLRTLGHHGLTNEVLTPEVLEQIMGALQQDDDHDTLSFEEFAIGFEKFVPDIEDAGVTDVQGIFLTQLQAAKSQITYLEQENGRLEQQNQELYQASQRGKMDEGLVEHALQIEARNKQVETENQALFREVQRLRQQLAHEAEEREELHSSPSSSPEAQARSLVMKERAVSQWRHAADSGLRQQLKHRLSQREEEYETFVTQLMESQAQDTQQQRLSLSEFMHKVDGLEDELRLHRDKEEEMTLALEQAQEECRSLQKQLEDAESIIQQKEKERNMALRFKKQSTDVFTQNPAFPSHESAMQGLTTALDDSPSLATELQDFLDMEGVEFNVGKSKPAQVAFSPSTTIVISEPDDPVAAATAELKTQLQQAEDRATAAEARLQEADTRAARLEAELQVARSSPSPDAAGPPVAAAAAAAAVAELRGALAKREEQLQHQTQKAVDLAEQLEVQTQQRRQLEAHMEQQRQELEPLLAQQTQKRKELESQMAIMTAQMSEERTQLATKAARLAEQRTQLEQHVAEQAEVCQRLEGEVRKQASLVKDLQNMTVQQIKELATLRQQLEEATALKQAEAERAGKAEAKLEQLEDKVVKQSRDLVEKDKIAQALRQNFTAREKDLSAMSEDLAQAKAEAQRFRDLHRELNSEHSKLKRQNSDHRDVIAMQKQELSGRINQLLEELDQAKAERDTQQERVRELERDNEEKATLHRTELQQAHEQLRAATDKLHARQASASEEAAAALSDLRAQLKEEHEKHARDVADLQERLRRANQQHEQAIQQLREQDQQLRNKEVDDLRQRLLKTSSDLEIQQDTLSKAQRKLAESDKEKDELTKKVDVQNHKIQAHMQDLDKMMEDMAKLRQKNKALLMQQTATGVEAGAKLEAQRQTVAQRLRQREQEVEKLKQEKQQLELRLAEQHAASDRELEVAREQLRQAHADSRLASQQHSDVMVQLQSRLADLQSRHEQAEREQLLQQQQWHTQQQPQQSGGQTALEATASQLASAEQQLQRSNKRVEALEAQELVLKAHLEQKDAQIKATEKRLQQEEKEHREREQRLTEENKRALTEHGDRVKRLQGEVTALKTQVGCKDRDLSKGDDEKTALVLKLREAESAMEELQRQLKQLKQQQGHEDKLSQAHAKAMSEVHETVEQLVQQLASSRKAAARADRAEQASADLAARVAQLEQENAHLSTDHARLQEQLTVESRRHEEALAAVSKSRSSTSTSSTTTVRRGSTFDCAHWLGWLLVGLLWMLLLLLFGVSEESCDASEWFVAARSREAAAIAMDRPRNY